MEGGRGAKYLRGVVFSEVHLCDKGLRMAQSMGES